MNIKSIHESPVLGQITQIYSLSHQELFELVKLMAFKAVSITRHLQGATAELPFQDHAEQAMEFATALMPEAIEEARHDYRPTGWAEDRQ
jgi:hypothetical protein